MEVQFPESQVFKSSRGEIGLAQNLARRHFNLPIVSVRQTDDISCGLCCLRMVMLYHGKDVTIELLQQMMPPSQDVGLYDSQVGLAAMKLGFTVTIFSYNYRIFHPLWNHLNRDELIQKLQLKKDMDNSPQLAFPVERYIEFLKTGGNLLFYPLSKEMVLAHFDHELPLIVALDMNFLYDCADFQDESSNSRPTHFVVLHGYDLERNTFDVTDPWYNIPIPHEDGHYSLDADRIINAIMIAQEKHDSAVIVIQKKAESR